MYEYEVMNKKTGERDILIGRNYEKLMESKGYDVKDYVLLFTEYVD